MVELRRLSPLILALSALILLLLIAYNPAYSPPLVPELLSLSLILFAGAISLRKERAEPLSTDEKRLLFFFWSVLLLFTTPRALWSLSHLPGQKWTPCLALSGTGALGCFLQAAITQNYGLRTLLLNYSALVYGTVAFFISRGGRDGGEYIVHALIGSSLVVAVTGFLSPLMSILNAPDLVTVLPRSFLFATDGHSHLTQFFPNPSWVWPYLIPATALSIHRFGTAREWRGRVLYGVFSLLFCGALLMNQQRGALLTLSLFLGLPFLYTVYERRGLSDLRRLLLGLALLMIIVVIGISLWMPELAGRFVSLERLRMWRGGIEYFWRDPLRGQGYAVWYNIIKTHEVTSGIPGIAYDTAHDLYIQLFAELGLLHGGVILALLVWLILRIRIRLLRLERGGLLFTLLLSGTLLATLVQEIDYLRTTCYLYALLAGVLVGGGGSAPREPATGKREEVGEYGKPGRRRFSIIFGGTGILLLGMALLLLPFLEFGIFPYEANIYLPQSPIRRWLGPQSLLAAKPDETAKIYSQYFLHTAKRPAFYRLNNGLEVKAIQENSKWRIALPLENGSLLFPRHHLISTGPTLPSGPRQITMQIEYPAVQSNLALYRFKNLEPVPPMVKGGLYRCRLNCEFIARSCGRIQDLRFQLRLPARENGNGVEVRVSALSEGELNSPYGQTIATRRLRGKPDRTTIYPLRYRLPTGVKGGFFHIRLREERETGSPIFLQDEPC